MKTLREIPVRQVPVVEPSTTIDEVVRLMEEEPLRTVALVGDGMYMGLFNEGALESSLIPPGTSLADLEVGPYVHPSRVVGSPDMPVALVVDLMRRKGQDIIPVVDNRTYRGVVTLADLEAAR
jgi:CBS domain-containing protein